MYSDYVIEPSPISALCWQIHRRLTVLVPLLRVWVRCPRASNGLLPRRSNLVGYVRWDARSDQSSLYRQSIQQLYRSQPGRILGNHTEDQGANLFADTLPSSCLSDSGNPYPIQTKPRPMPVHDGPGSDQDERLPPPGPERSQRNPKQLVQGSQPTARLLRVQSQQLPTESYVFKDEVLLGTESADHPPEDVPERGDHGKNLIETIRIQLFAKSFILQMYDVLASHPDVLPLEESKSGFSPRIRDSRSQSSQGSERCLASPCSQRRTTSPASRHIDPPMSTESTVRCYPYHPARSAPGSASFHRSNSLSPHRQAPSGARPTRGPCPHSSQAGTCGRILRA